MFVVFELVFDFSFEFSRDYKIRNVDKYAVKVLDALSMAHLLHSEMATGNPAKSHK